MLLVLIMCCYSTRHPSIWYLKKKFTVSHSSAGWLRRSAFPVAWGSGEVGCSTMASLTWQVVDIGCQPLFCFVRVSSCGRLSFLTTWWLGFKEACSTWRKWKLQTSWDSSLEVTQSLWPDAVQNRLGQPGMLECRSRWERRQRTCCQSTTLPLLLLTIVIALITLRCQDLFLQLSLCQSPP